MTVRERGSDPNESIDRHIMVKNLAMSQKYIKWTIFLTDACDQGDRPGARILSAWLASKNWTEAIPGYNSMSPFDKQEFKRAMQAASGPHLYQQSHSTKKMVLCHIRDHHTTIVETHAVFCRDECQGTTGNLCHNHMMDATERTCKVADNDDETTEDMENYTHNIETNNKTRL